MDSTYAPQSPDLSSFLPSKPSPTPQEQSHRSQQQTRGDSYGSYQSEQSFSSSSYAPRSPTFPFNNQPSPHLQGRRQEQLQDQHRHHHLSEREFPQYENSAEYMPPIPSLPPSPIQHHPSGAPTSAPYHIKPEPSQHRASMSRAPRGSRVKEEPASIPLSTPIKAPPPSIDIKTKFPVARIKRIMQADEEVGKVAQVTPVAVNKALELFMTALVLGAAERVREKGGKRITAAHLKTVVEADEQFDFLGEIVGRVQDSVEVEKKRKGAGKESDSDEDSGERKVKKGKGRRKKNAD